MSLPLFPPSLFSIRQRVLPGFVVFIVTLASYGVVVHERKPETFRAGRIYLMMAVLAEMALLTGLFLAVAAAELLVRSIHDYLPNAVQRLH